MKKKATTITVFTFLTIAAFANNVTNPFWKQTFNSSLPSSWVIGDESGQGVLWERCENPNSCLPISITGSNCKNDEFRSTGFDDGYMFVNSYDHGLLPTKSKSFLRTEQIDCSNKPSVFIQFQTYIRAIYQAPTSNAVLRVRSGNGPWTIFTIFPHLNPNEMETLESWNAEPVLLDISSAAANKSNVTIEWYWTAKYDIIWMLDDVALFDANPQLDNIIWGQTQGTFAGGMNGWTVTHVSDTCRWRWTNLGLAYLPFGGEEADYYACWAGAENGAMLMNASSCSVKDTISPNPTPFSKSDLVSPPINLSGITAGTKLDLRYNQAFALGNHAPLFGLPITSISISIDNGLSYLDENSVNYLQPFLQGKCEDVSIRLPSQVAGKPQVRVKFTFSGDTHFWMLDNVRISFANDQDLKLNPDFYNIAPDFSQPKYQTRPLQLFAQVKNDGNLPMEDVVVISQVKNSLNTVVFQDSVVLGLFEPSDTFLDITFPNKFTPAPQIEKYQIFYRVKSSTPDQNSDNNYVHSQYEVTEGVFAKNDFCATSMGYFFPSESVKYEVGNCYYMPKGSKIKAKSVSFAYQNTDNLGTAGAVLGINLYQWKKGNNHGDINNDTIANADEYELIAYNLYQASIDDKNMMVTVPVSGEVDSVDLEDDTYYFVTVAYLDPVAIGGTVMPFPIAGSEEFNYTALFHNSYEDGIPAYTSMLKEGDDDYFRANAWALRRIPFINLNVVQLVSGTQPTIPKDWNLKVSPNPAHESISLTCDFVGYNQPSKVEFFDICGRLALSRDFQNGFVSQLPIDVSELSNGSYTLRVVSGTSVASCKIMVIH